MKNNYVHFINKENITVLTAYAYEGLHVAVKVSYLLVFVSYCNSIHKHHDKRCFMVIIHFSYYHNIHMHRDERRCFMVIL